MSGAATARGGIAELGEMIGLQLGPSDWRNVSQRDIDAFADLSGDHQWIHVDAERAKVESPYGTTIAHGNLTLSMVDGLREQLIEPTGVAMAVNYGWNKVRFPAPVPVDSRVRARAEIVSLTELDAGWWELVARFTIEVEEAEKPSFVGDSVIRLQATPDR